MQASEKAGYLAAIVILIFGGMFLRTMLLNWIVGPGIVVGAVVLSNRLFGPSSREENAQVEDPT